MTGPRDVRPSDVSVVVCTVSGRRWDLLRAAVSSLHGQSERPGEVIVVVDHNPDLLARVEAELAGVRSATNVEAPGLSGARNTGVAAAEGSVVAFLDDDAAAGPDWLSRLTAPYDDPDVAGVGGAALPNWQSGRPRWWPEEFDWVVGCSYRGLPTEQEPVRNFIGCNMSFRADVFSELGGFDSGLGRRGQRALGCEETELCLRLTRHSPDARLVYEPRATVKHLVPADRACWSYFRRRCFAEGQSKATVARLAGRGPALATERAYTRSTLTSGVRRHLRSALRSGDTAGFGRAASIAGGFTMAAAGYATTALRGDPR